MFPPHAVNMASGHHRTGSVSTTAGILQEENVDTGHRQGKPDFYDQKGKL